MLFQVLIAVFLVVYLGILAFVFGRRLWGFAPKQSEPIRKHLPLDDAESEALIEVLNIYKSFDHPVLKGIALSIEEGETVGVLGASGSGKSVLLKLIAGFLRPDRGWIFFRGRDLSTMEESELLQVRKRVSYVFQHGAVFDFLDVGENIAYPLREQGVTDEEAIRERVDYLLDAVELDGMGRYTYDELSAGGKKQVAIARAIANDPQVILYDEPTTGVDPIIGKSISRLIRKLNKQENLTSVVVTHDLKCMDIVADRVILLKDGLIRFEGDLRQLRASTDDYVQAFIAGQRWREDPPPGGGANLKSQVSNFK